MSSGTGPAPPFFPVAAEMNELDSIDEVIPGALWVTNFRSASHPEELHKRKITHIAAVGTEFEDDNLANFTYWKRNLYDDDSEAGVMAEALRAGAKFIHDALKSKGRVLVHCAAGISRSATVALAYMVIYRRQSLRDAFQELISKRRVVWPNDGFMAQLIALEQELSNGQATISLDEYIVWGDYDGPAADIEASSGVHQATRDCLPRMKREGTFVDQATRQEELVVGAKEASASPRSASSEPSKLEPPCISLQPSESDPSSPEFSKRHSINRAERKARAEWSTAEAAETSWSRRYSSEEESSPTSMIGRGSPSIKEEASTSNVAAVAPASHADAIATAAAVPQWLAALLDALADGTFLSVVSRFCAAECHHFLGNDSYTLVQTDIHRRYRRLFESRIEAQLRLHQISPSRFQDAVAAAHDATEGEDSLLRLLQAVEDFETFARMMAQRAIEQES